MQGRSITIEDINQLLDVVVDKKKRIIYQKGYEENIANNDNFLREYNFTKWFYTPESYLKGNYVKEKIIKTYYYYYISSIIGKEKEKDIINKNVRYFLASSGVDVLFDDIRFGVGTVDNDIVGNSRIYLLYSSGFWKDYRLAVRPILYLKPNETFNSLLIK